jgi:4-alpha-glucanotransferase
MEFIHRGGRNSGFAIPLLAARTDRGPCGEFPDIVPLAQLAKKWGMNLLQLLPVNDSGWQTSPYSALSAFALNPVYLRIGNLPEYAALQPGDEKTDFDRELAELNAAGSGSRKVAYSAILERKWSILKKLWAATRRSASGEVLAADVGQWADGHAWVKAYACFMELKSRHGGLPWWEWPEHRDIDADGIAGLWNLEPLMEGLRFQAWVQRVCELQFGEACREAFGLGVDVMGDIPILLNADSSDIWERRSLFDMGKSAGAPPDMYSVSGQNWGFPLYRWDEIERSGYAFWKERLRSADHFYSLYRIDHVLGFFRIWAVDKAERDGFLGHFIPEFPISYPELYALGFDAPRIRWLSKPHVREEALAGALRDLPWAVAERLTEKLFSRIGNEALFLFSEQVKGSADIKDALYSESGSGVQHEILEHCAQALVLFWRDRAFLEVSPGQFLPTWEFRGTGAWKSLSDAERGVLEAMILRRKGESLTLWEKTGRRILAALSQSVPMQACAEDLGAVPPCVPLVLGELGIPGLRVLRWNRDYNAQGAPHAGFDEYPENTVACTSVHDSTNLRQWWMEEADREAVWAMVREAELRHGWRASSPGPADEETAPDELSPGNAFALLRAFATVRSSILVFPLQDILASHAVWRENDPADERINTPGISNDSNWLYRMKPSLEALLGDEEFSGRVALLAATHREG